MDKAHLIEVACLIGVLVLSLGIHEYGHALVAYLCGDDTAQREGRMTVNPVAHIDPFMTIILPAALYFSTNGSFIFGGARPVPVDPRRLRHPLRDMMYVALAGPATNVVLAVLFMLLWKSSLTHWGYGPNDLMPRVLDGASFFNIVLAVFNMMPIPPLDGSRVMTYLLPAPLRGPYVSLERFGILLVILIIYFVPGVRGAVFESMAWLYAQLYALTGGDWRR